MAIDLNTQKMAKLQASQILVKDAKLTVEKISEKNVAVTKLIDDTKQKQSEILKLKQVDQDSLRTVVQL